ncbi:MAG: hypothetical protein AAB071_04620 [Bacteroidota bacterium]
MLKFTQTTYRITIFVFLFLFLGEGIFGEFYHTHSFVSSKATSIKLDDCNDGHHHTTEQHKDCLACVRATQFVIIFVPLVSYSLEYYRIGTALILSFTHQQNFYISFSKRGPPQIFSLA